MTLTLILGLVRALVIGIAAMIEDERLGVAFGQIIALLHTADRLAAGAEPEKLPTYEDGFAEWRRLRGQEPPA